MSNLGILGSVQLPGYYSVDEGLKKIGVLKKLLGSQVFYLLKQHPLGFQGQESFMSVSSKQFNFPDFLLRELGNSRIVAYAQGKDRWSEDRIVIVFYDADDKLCHIDVQRGIPSQKIVLAPEGLGDDVIIDGLLGNGFVRVQPAGIFVPDDSL